MTLPSGRARILVACASPPAVRAIYTELLGQVADVVYLEDAADRSRALSAADVIVSFLPHSDIGDTEWPHVAASLLQVMTSGVDHIRRDILPAGTRIAALPGAQSQAIAEHALALALAAAKRLLPFHRALAQGAFDLSTTTTMLAGGTCCVIGLGEMGRAVARLFHAIGMRVQGVSRSGTTSEPAIAAVVAPDRLHATLAEANVVVLATPLNDDTRGMIGADALRAMRGDAILINVARAKVVEQDALYRHMKDNPDFHACIDVWWEEPFNQGRFHLDYPFFDLPNLIGTPHCASRIPAMPAIMARRAAANVLDYLLTGTCRHLAP